eukprot:238693-Hanusia_phi.AAC.1
MWDWWHMAHGVFFRGHKGRFRCLFYISKIEGGLGHPSDTRKRSVAGGVVLIGSIGSFCEGLGVECGLSRLCRGGEGRLDCIQDAWGDPGTF